MKALVVTHDAVSRIAEPDAAIGVNHHVVRGIERFAVVAFGQHGGMAVVLVADHAAAGVPAGDLPAFEIEGVAVAIAGRAADVVTVEDGIEDLVLGEAAVDGDDVGIGIANGIAIGPIARSLGE